MVALTQSIILGKGLGFIGNTNLSQSLNSFGETKFHFKRPMTSDDRNYVRASLPRAIIGIGVYPKHAPNELLFQNFKYPQWNGASSVYQIAAQLLCCNTVPE